MSDDLERLEQAIRESDAPPLDPARRARMRSRVLAAEIPPQPGLAGVGGAWRRVGIAAAAALLVVALGLGGAASASLPGDPAFVLKVGAERLGLFLSSDLYKRLDDTLQQADRRLGELDVLSHRDTSRLAVAADAYDRSLADVRAAFEAMAASTHSARSRAIEETRLKLDGHISKLVEIERFTDGDVERALDEARELGDRVREVEAEGGGADDRAAPTASPRQTVSGTATPDGGPGAPAATARPTRTAEPSHSPDPTATAAPLGTVAPTKTPEPTRTADPTRTLEPARSPDSSQNPQPTRTPSPSPSRS